jgi:WD40 repeat protein
MIATLSSDEMSTTVEIWEVKNRRRISDLKFYGSAIKNFSWSFDSQKFAFELTTASAFGMVNSVRLYQVADTNNSRIIDLSNESDDQLSLLWTHNGQKLLLITPQSIDIYKANDLSKTNSLKHPLAKAISLSLDDKLLALGMDDGTIRIWDVSDLIVN